MKTQNLFRMVRVLPGSLLSGFLPGVLKRTGWGLLCLLIFLFPVPPGFASPPAEAGPDLLVDGTGTGQEPEPLPPWKQTRFPDPVLVTGEILMGFEGLEIRGLRLFRWRDGDFEAIRFQVDERTEDMDWVFPYGKKNNARRGNGKLDGRDVLLFMARDAGARASGELEMPGAARMEAITLEDPVDGSRRWVYLAFFPKDPPPLCPLPDYVRYDYENEEVATDCVFSKFIITPDGLHTSFSDVGGIPVVSGGSGGNRIDRLKFRVEIRFFFNLIPLRVHEEVMGQDVVAYIQGPIRVIRRMEQFMKLPFGVRGLRTYSDVHHFEGVVVVPIEVHVPRGVVRIVNKANIRFGMDFDPVAIGDYFRNSENPEPLVIDGRMSPSEKLYCRHEDRWKMAYGPSGVYMTRSVIPPEVRSMMEIHQEYEDDLSTPWPPENSPGSIGFAYSDLEMVKGRGRAGRHRFFMDVYFPPFYEIGDETIYLDLRDRPLKIIVGDRVAGNNLDMEREVSEDFTK